ncbi:SSI family serine proteinase inhibitor [Streptomyces griseus]|uniref:SSI family serine proteinase inhibitor n=2 Tax=Streptomyces griseus TaxID=1911 RepID=UPI0007C7C170|nr:SSI family serine proteinase inhibitor [Streptomyces griseus]
MITHIPAALLAALLLAAPTAGVASTAGAAPAGPPSPAEASSFLPGASPFLPTAPATTLRLTVTGPATTAPAPGAAVPAAPASRTVTLHCGPAGGDHPRAEAACADLDASGGRVDRDSDTACVLLYDPVEVRAEGVWRGRPVSFARQYGNSCELGARTGAVFSF